MTRSMRLLIWVGGAALLAATAIDTIAVMGRQVGLPLTGSIELMQAVVLVAGAVGLVVATIEQSHARVRLLVARMGPRGQLVADRLSDALTLLFCLALLIGSSWIAAELWDSHEQSELVGIPWRVLRLIANACLLAACTVLAWRIVRPRPQ
jgi:TRAP-type C4-dicarboxylate transport system permease small subunit